MIRLRKHLWFAACDVFHHLDWTRAYLWALGHAVDAIEWEVERAP